MLLSKQFEGPQSAVYRHRRNTKLGIYPIFILLLACGFVHQVDSADCETSDNLLVDSEFATVGVSNVWRYAQHTGERSFSLDVEEGELAITRIATQPWMLLKHQVAEAAFSGANIRFSAELKGELPTAPSLHGFEHKAGLYIKLGRARAELAPHEYNKETFGWQTVSLERSVPQGVTKLEVGFVHQAGGTLWARSPELVIVTCKDD
jgi:hypothetical protein